MAERDAEDRVIGTAIQSLREARNMTLQSLAANADFTFDYLSRIENGNAIISSWAVVRIARELGIAGVPLVGSPDKEIFAAAEQLRLHFLQSIQTVTDGDAVSQ